MSNDSDPKNLPPTQNYNLLNVSTATNADMRYGASAENNPVVGWTPNTTSANQNWHAEIEDIDGTLGTITLLSLASGTYARAPQPIDGGSIVGGAAKYVFTLRKIESGKYRIEIMGEDLAVTLPAAGDDQQIVLKPKGISTNQQWIFQQIQT